MKKYFAVFSIFSVFSTFTYASSFEQALIDNSEKITEIKKECGSTIVGPVYTAAESWAVLSYQFNLHYSFWGLSEKECRVNLRVDSTNVPVDAGVIYTLTYEKIEK